MIIIKRNDWLSEHKNHCSNFRLKSDYVKSKILKINDGINKLIKKKNKIANLDLEILRIIVKKLKSKLINSTKVGLLCSGGEDSIYLLIILVNKLKIKPKLLCYQTKNNFSDVRRIKKIAENLNLELFLYDKFNLDRRHAYDKFVVSQKRQPNDIAQPVHNALYFEGIEKHNCDIVIDGQFCDTVLLSNPQNHFLYWTEKCPGVLQILIKFLNYLPLKEDTKIKSRLLKLKLLMNTNNPATHIFKLINLEEPDNDLIFLTEKLIKKIGTQLTFSIFFYYCLLSARERDKYLLCPSLFSPFDNFQLAILSSKNIEQVISHFIRKKPIRNLCKKSFPALFRFQNTLPFELE
jgi:hypothetical protein